MSMEVQSIIIQLTQPEHESAPRVIAKYAANGNFQNTPSQNMAVQILFTGNPPEGYDTAGQLSAEALTALNNFITALSPVLV